MPLVDELEKSGNTLFRWRSYIPIVMIALILAAMRDFTYLGGSEVLDHVWEAFCLLVGLFGFGIRVLTIGHVPRRTSGRNARSQVAETLNTTGMYSIVRNPLYLGNFFMGLGVALFPHLWWLVVIYTLLFWVYYERIIFAEEAFLTRKFGDEFLSWANATPPMLPRLRLYRRPDLPFSVRNVLRREYNGFNALILVMFLLEVTGDLVVKGRVDFEWGWVLLVTLAVGARLVLRSLKKYTRVLNVEGRV